MPDNYIDSHDNIYLTNFVSEPPTRPKEGWFKSDICERSVKASQYHIQQIKELSAKGIGPFVLIAQIHHLVLAILEFIPVLGWVITIIDSELRTARISANQNKVSDYINNNKKRLSDRYEPITVTPPVLTEEFWDDEESVKKNLKNMLGLTEFGECYKKISNRLKSSKNFILDILADETIRAPIMIYNFISKVLRCDRAIVDKAISSRPELLSIIDKNIPQDILVDILTKNPSYIEHLSVDRESDIDFMDKMLASNPENIMIFSKSMRENITKPQALKIVGNNPLYLRYLSDAQRGDLDIALTAVNLDGHALEFVSEELQRKKVIVKAAVKQDPYALMYAHRSLRKDPIFLMDLVKQDGLALEVIPKQVEDLDYNELYKEAVKENGLALRHVPFHLRDNRELILLAVKNNGQALQFAPFDHKNDIEIAKAAVKNDPKAIEYVNLDITQEPKGLLELMKANPAIYIDLPEKYKTDMEFLKALFAINPAFYFTLPENLQNDTKVAIELVKVDGSWLEHLSLEHRNNLNVVRAAVSQNGLALQFAMKWLRGLESVVVTAVEQDPLALQYASIEFKRDRDLVLGALIKNPKSLQYAALHLQMNRDFKTLAEIFMKMPNNATK